MPFIRRRYIPGDQLEYGPGSEDYEYDDWRQRQDDDAAEEAARHEELLQQQRQEQHHD